MNINPIGMIQQVAIEVDPELIQAIENVANAIEHVAEAINDSNNEKNYFMED